MILVFENYIVHYLTVKNYQPDERLGKFFPVKAAARCIKKWGEI